MPCILGTACNAHTSGTSSRCSHWPIRTERLSFSVTLASPQGRLRISSTRQRRCRIATATFRERRVRACGDIPAKPRFDSCIDEVLFFFCWIDAIVGVVLGRRGLGRFDVVQSAALLSHLRHAKVRCRCRITSVRLVVLVSAHGVLVLVGMIRVHRHADAFQPTEVDVPCQT